MKDLSESKFNYIIGNPPYNASGIVCREKHQKFYNELGAGGKHGSLAFLMKGLDKLKPGGSVIYIIPTNGMVLNGSKGFREYVKKTNGSIVDLWVTNKDVFRNKETNKLEACIQGNTFIIKIEKTPNKNVSITTEYSNGLEFKTTTNYSLYGTEYYPLCLSESCEIVLNKCINGKEISLEKYLIKGGHNNISNNKIYEKIKDDYKSTTKVKCCDEDMFEIKSTSIEDMHNTVQDKNISEKDIFDVEFVSEPNYENERKNSFKKVMAKLNRGQNIHYGWSSVNDPDERSKGWKVVFSPICKVKEIMQYGKVSTGLLEPDVMVQQNYSYFSFCSREHAEYFIKYLSHPLFVISLIQLFDNAYINSSNIGRLTIPPYKEFNDTKDFERYVWDYYKIDSQDEQNVNKIYNDILRSENQ